MQNNDSEDLEFNGLSIKDTPSLVARPVMETEDKEPNVGFQAQPLKGGRLAEGYTYSSPFTDGEVKAGETPTTAPITTEITPDELSAFINRIKDTGDKDSLVKMILTDSLLTSMSNANCQTITNNTKSAQYIDVDGRKVGCNTVKPSSAAGKLTGAAAIRQVMSRMSTGREKVQRLAKSGFNVVVGFISERDKLSLQYKLINLVHDVGMETGGLLMSYDDAHVEVVITDFILDHVVNCSVIGWDRAWLADNFLIADTQLLHAAGLAAMYPNGYPFYRSCVYKNMVDADCDWSTITKDLEDITKIKRLDFSLLSMYKVELLTRADKIMLAAASNTITKEAVVAYQEKSNAIKRLGPIHTNESVSFHLDVRSPVFSKYRRESARWLNNITNLIDDVLMTAPILDEDGDYNRRINTYNEFLNATRLEYYASWIQNVVEIDTDEDSVKLYGGDEQEDINTKFDILGVLASDEETVETGIVLVSDFSIECMYGYTGIHDFQCPTCERGQRTTVDTLEGVIFFNVTNYFFELMKKELG